MNLGDIALPPIQRGDARLAVLDVTKWFGETSGGVRTYLLQKGAFVAARNEYRQILVTPGADDAIIDQPGVRWYRLRGPRIPSQPQYRFLLATSSLRRIIEHECPDVIEVGSQLFVPWVARLAIRRRPTPLVGFYHGNLERSFAGANEARPEGSTLRRRMGRRYVSIVDRLFSARIAASDGLASDLTTAGVRDITRVPLGVDLSTFHPRLREHRGTIRRQLGVGENAPMFIYVGRIAPEKRLDVALHAWPDLAESTNATLVIVGTGPLLERYRSTSRTTRVIWQPFENDRARLAQMLAAADVYLAPGPIETFGLAALEALACGTPVLSVDAGGVAELVRRSGAGALYEAGSPTSLTDSACRLLGANLASLGRRGREFAEREHSWPRVFEQLFGLYAKVAGQ